MQIVDLNGFDQTKVKNVGSVTQLLHNLQNIKHQFGNRLDDVTLFYRGQADRSWEIKPSIYRNNREIDREHLMLSEITRRCPNEFLQCHSSFERLVKMQHYSLHTRLIDVTTNPLIAAFFASNGEYDHDGVIEMFLVKNEDIKPYNDKWVNLIAYISFVCPELLDIGTDNDKWSNFISTMHNEGEPMPYLKKDVSDFDKALCVLPILDNPRLTRQQGAFFIFGIKNGKKTEISDLVVSKIPIRIKHGDGKEKLLGELDELGINESFCFPEIDKVTHYLNEHR